MGFIHYNMTVEEQLHNVQVRGAGGAAAAAAAALAAVASGGSGGWRRTELGAPTTAVP